MTLRMNLVCAVQWGVAICGAHGSYRALAQCSSLSVSCLQFSKIMFTFFAGEEKNQLKSK